MIFEFTLLAGYNYAFAAGFLGATFFMIVELQAGINRASATALRSEWTYSMITLRCAFGIGAATILYFIFLADPVSSELWPEIKDIGTYRIGVQNCIPGPVDLSSCSPKLLTNTHASLLILWCFLSGYSQKLVPSILAKKTETEVLI